MEPVTTPTLLPELMTTSLPRSSVICAPEPVTSMALELELCAVTNPPS